MLDILTWILHIIVAYPGTFAIIFIGLTVYWWSSDALENNDDIISVGVQGWYMGLLFAVGLLLGFRWLIIN